MGDVTWNRVGPIENENSIYRRIQSPRSVSLASLNGQCPFQSTKAFRLLVAQNQFTMVTHCHCPTL